VIQVAQRQNGTAQSEFRPVSNWRAMPEFWNLRPAGILEEKQRMTLF
jgi:hypothetical protein